MSTLLKEELYINSDGIKDLNVIFNLPKYTRGKSKFARSIFLQIAQSSLDYCDFMRINQIFNDWDSYQSNGGKIKNYIKDLKEIDKSSLLLVWYNYNNILYKLDASRSLSPIEKAITYQNYSLSCCCF